VGAYQGPTANGNPAFIDVTLRVAEGFWVVPTAVALRTTVPVPGEPTAYETATVVD
jgi:hypothetical protein